MKNLKTILLTALVGIGVAVTYFYFEYAVHHSISYIWEDLFDTESSRLIVLPICLILTLIYFGAVHLFDPKTENKESHGLGSAPKPTILNFIKVLGIGFLSLIAGASLGPEAVLVPACVLLGGYVGLKLGKSKPDAKVLGMAGFIALIAAFFNSFFVGLLSLLLIRKEFKIKIDTKLIVVSVVASGSAAFTLGLLESSAFVVVPDYSWKLNIEEIVLLAVLGLAGYMVTYALKALHDAGVTINKLIGQKQWWSRGLVAGGGLSIIYLLGGPLVQFTGNESIVPMLQQSAGLGFIGLAWILLIKLAAISWSKASGYRGGLVFPTVFAASVLVAMAHLIMDDINFIYGLIVVMAGVIIADIKVKFLF